ncbi:MAG TPA: dienelactone hydrolase family protein [Flavitalea sp.]|nr:dienelactone hydrolase family protein [Flavitalea sp.]
MRNPQKRALLACALALFMFSACKKNLSIDQSSNADFVVETALPVHTAVNAYVNDNCAGYYKAIPARYDSSEKKYPLILFMHGIGELGTDLSKMLRAGLPQLINRKKFPADFEVNGEHFSFVVFSPQFKKWPTNNDVKSVLDYAVKHFRIDTSRIYVTGLSMGGGVTWEFDAQYGGSVAAIAPICGGSWPDSKRAEKLASFDLPVWAFHNVDDNIVPVSYTIDYVNKINSFNPSVKAKYTTWATGGHDAWTKAYDPATKDAGKNVYEWMLQYRRAIK